MVDKIAMKKTCLPGKSNFAKTYPTSGAKTMCEQVISPATKIELKRKRPKGAAAKSLPMFSHCHFAGMRTADPPETSASDWKAKEIMYSSGATAIAAAIQMKISETRRAPGKSSSSAMLFFFLMTAEAGGGVGTHIIVPLSFVPSESGSGTKP